MQRAADEFADWLFNRDIEPKTGTDAEIIAAMRARRRWRLKNNPIGVEYDPARWLAELRAGATEQSLLSRQGDLPASPIRGALETHYT